MLSSAGVGNDWVKAFLETQLLKQEMSVFNKVTKNKLNNRIKKPPKIPKLVETLTEDVHVFRLLAEKNVSFNDDFKTSS